MVPSGVLWQILRRFDLPTLSVQGHEASSEPWSNVHIQEAELWPSLPLWSIFNIYPKTFKSGHYRVIFEQMDGKMVLFLNSRLFILSLFIYVFPLYPMWKMKLLNPNANFNSPKMCNYWSKQCKKPCNELQTDKKCMKWVLNVSFTQVPAEMPTWQSTTFQRRRRAESYLGLNVQKMWTEWRSTTRSR